jgi:hypothetical protein
MDGRAQGIYDILSFTEYMRLAWLVAFGRTVRPTFFFLRFIS